MLLSVLITRAWSLFHGILTRMLVERLLDFHQEAPVDWAAFDYTYRFLHFSWPFSIPNGLLDRFPRLHGVWTPCSGQPEVQHFKNVSPPLRRDLRVRKNTLSQSLRRVSWEAGSSRRMQVEKQLQTASATMLEVVFWLAICSQKQLCTLVDHNGHAVHASVCVCLCVCLLNLIPFTKINE